MKPLDLKKYIDESNLSSKRDNANETFEEYQRRRRNNNKAISAYLKGKYVVLNGDN